jgi:putative ABC transport system permease protein
LRTGKVWIVWLALRELWAWRYRSLLSLLALALSVGLVVATGSIGALMQASVATPAPLLGRPADLWISSAYDVDYDLPADLKAQVEAVDGVAEVQPVLRRPVRVQTPRADTLALLGVELGPYFAFHDLTLAAGAFPSADEAGLVALAPWIFVRDLCLGAPVTVTTPSGDVALLITGLVEIESLADAQQGLVLYAPLDAVANLFDLHDTATALEVRLAPGASLRQVRTDLAHVLGPAYAVSATSQPGQGVQLWQRLVLGALIFVDALTLTGSACLIYAVFASAARARRRQIGLLRVVGAVRRQVLALLVIEAVLLGVIGSGMGLVVGLLFAQRGADLVLQTTTFFPVSTDDPTVLPFLVESLLLAVTLGVLSSLVGSIGPAMRAARQPPLIALRTMPHQSLSRIGSSRLWRTLRHPVCPLQARLAVSNLGREWDRTVLIVGTLALILAMALGNVGVLSLLGEELATTFGRLTGGDYLVLPGLTSISLRELAGQDTSDVPPLSSGLLAALEELRDQVWLMNGTTADVVPLQTFPGQPTLLLDIEGYAQMGGFRFQEGNWPGALDAFRQGPAVLLTPVVAHRLNVGLGDQVRLDTRQGPVDFSVAGIGDSEFTTCVLDLTDGATYFGANEINAVQVQLRPDVDVEVVRRALLDAIQTHGGTLLSLNQTLGQLREVFHQAWLSIALLIGVTGLVAGLGVVNAMLTSVVERRREIGLLRAVGTTRPQVRRMVLTEAVILGTMSAAIGTALGWAVSFLFLGVARTYLGLSGEGAASLSAWTPLVISSVVGLVLWPLLAMLGGLGPTVYAARLPVIQALYETTSNFQA